MDPITLQTPDRTAADGTKRIISQRNEKMDILKGAAIVCMVLAHSGFPFTDQIYLFHMAVFMMASGYFFNKKNAVSVKAVCQYTFRKFCSFYIPYVLFNGFVFILTNFFIKVNIVTNDERFLALAGEGAAWGLVYPFDRQTLLICLKALIRFEFEPQLGGATWFLRALFYVSVGHCLLMWVLQKIKPKAIRTTLFGIIILICCACAAETQNGASILPSKYKMLFACYLAYALGIFVRKAEHLFHYNIHSCIFSATLLYVLNSLGGISLGVGAIENIPFFIMASLLGWIMLRSAAELLTGPFAKALACTGKHTMAVMLWHFLAFKLVTLAMILLRGEDLLLLASFPHLDGASSYLWILYTLVGTAVPTLLGMGYQTVKNKFLYYTRGLYENLRNRCRRTTGS